MVKGTNSDALAVKMNLISVHCDITAAFIHGRVSVTETIYVHQPRGFHRGNGNEVRCLKRTLYGMKQSPQYFCLVPRPIPINRHYQRIMYSITSQDASRV